MKTNTAWLKVIILCLPGLGFSKDVLTMIPKNNAVSVGQRMEMECRVGNGSLVRTWSYIPTSSETPVTIVTNANTGIETAPNLSRFGLDVDETGSGILYLNSTKMDDAGIYICEAEEGSKSVKFSAQLIVIGLESEPICETNLTKGINLNHTASVWMRCLVQFRGNWTPSVEWRQHCGDEDGQDGRVLNQNIETVIIRNSNIASTFLTMVTPCSGQMSFYSWKVFFSWQNGSITTNATNIPNFGYMWKSPNFTFVSSTTEAESSTTRSTVIDFTERTTSAVGTGNRFSDVLIIPLGIISLTLFLLTLVTVIVCCVIVRRKTAEWMANFVSTYQRVEPRVISDGQRTTAESLPNINNTGCSASDGCQLRTMTLGGYTSVDDLAEECSLVVGKQTAEATCTSSLYSAISREKKGNRAAPSTSNTTYSIVHDEPFIYDTLRKGIDAPRNESYANDDSDEDD